MFFLLSNELLFRSTGFNASGFVVQDCLKSAGEGAIDIQSMAEVVFENTIFRSNLKRAIVVSSNTSLALQSCYFENNGDQHSYASAISVEFNVSLWIQDSLFYGTCQLTNKELSLTLFLASLNVTRIV